MRCSRTEAPSLHRRYPASPVIRASPPPCPTRPDPHGLSVGSYVATGRVSRVASTPLFPACRRHYPGGAGRCWRRSLPDPWQPSPLNRRVGFRVIGFEACTAFRILRPAWSLNRPRRPFAIEVLQTMSLPPSSAPTVTGWSDSCRAGFAPAEEWRLFAAHYSISTKMVGKATSPQAWESRFCSMSARIISSIAGTSAAMISAPSLIWSRPLPPRYVVPP